MTEQPKTRVLLLVEDNPGDAGLVHAMATGDARGSFQVVHVTRISEALDTLRSMPVDVVVLDLGLPDCEGIESVKALRAVASLPIVVLTGSDNEQLALDCLNAGAQDYLTKSETRLDHLRRAIGYALTRTREAQIRDLQQSLERYRAMSSAGQTTVVTAALAGSGAVSLRAPQTFEQMVAAYVTLFDDNPATAENRAVALRAEKEHIVTLLGDASGGPRDLLDVHVAALDRAVSSRNPSLSRSIIVEARLLALEMMGLLVDYFRVGHRRRFVQGAET